MIKGKNQCDNKYGNNTHTALWRHAYKIYGEKLFVSDAIGNVLKKSFSSFKKLPSEEVFMKTYCK